MEKRNISMLRFLGLMIAVCVLAGSALGQSTRDSTGTVAFTENVSTSPVSQDSNPPITLELDQVPLKEALKRIADQAKAGLYYNAAHLPEKTVSLHLKAVPLGTALRKVLEGTMLQVVTSGRNITLRPEGIPRQMQSPPANAQETITGTVTDGSTGNTLPGVNIKVKGTTTGTSTGPNGQYELTVESLQDTLVFSFVGYRTQEVPINGRTEINIEMQSQAISGEEMVVVGYGTKSKKKLTTSVATVDAKQINDMPITNVADAFTGNISGVMVQEGSGAPGDVPIIRIRGYGSINAGSDPLYVIDGMIVTANQVRYLNTKSIESVNVLKDAAAGAIYGSRAGNGVIIIKTKEGSGKPKFSYNSTIGFQQVEKTIPVLSGPEYIAYAKKAYEASGLEEPTFSPDVANTNWQDEIFRTGVFQNHQLSANGGNEKINYNISFSYRRNKGVILTTYENDYSSNGNFNIKLSDKLDVGLIYNATYAKIRNNPKLGGAAHGSGGILEDAIVQYPVIPVYMENGDYGQQTSKDWGTSVVYGGYGNPVAGLKEVYDYHNRFSAIGKAFLNYEPIEGLNVKASFSGTNNVGYEDYHESPYLAADGHTRTANFSNPRYDQIGASQSNFMDNSYIAEGSIEYKSTFSTDHNFDIIAGLSGEYSGSRSTSASATINDRGANAEDPLPAFDNYLRPNIYGANDVSGGGGFSEETFTSLFGRVNYDYKDKYLFMVSVRRDGSSKFAPGSRFGIFPAVSAGWRLTEEPFMQNQDFFNDLKLRLSYGLSGNDQIGNYAWQGSVSYGGQYLFGPSDSDYSEGIATTEYPASIENSNLKWEVSEQYNAGINLSVLDNRVQLVSDFYIKNTKDLLLSQPLPSENGISNSILSNIGDLSNKGIELNLTTTNVRTHDFTWSTKFIFNKVWNKATAIHAPDGIIRLSSGEYDVVRIIEGEEMFQIYGYKTLGVFKSEDQLQQYSRPSGSKLGDPIIKDVNQDGIINSDDYVKLGDGLPDFTSGLSSNFSYKNLGLNIVLDGSYGASKYLPAFRNQNWVSPNEGNISKYIYERAGKIYGEPNLDYTGNRLTPNSYDVFDASYIRIKNLTLGYSLPKRICNSLSVSDLRLTLSVQNFHTFTSYPWYNVQANYYNGRAGTAQFGVDYGGYPRARRYTFGINLAF